jgi:hypothetical protein
VRTQITSPGCASLVAREIVAKGAAPVPGFESAPVGATYTVHSSADDTVVGVKDPAPVVGAAADLDAAAAVVEGPRERAAFAARRRRSRSVCVVRAAGVSVTEVGPGPTCADSETADQSRKPPQPSHELHGEVDVALAVIGAATASMVHTTTARRVRRRSRARRACKSAARRPRNTAMAAPARAEFR